MMTSPAELTCQELVELVTEYLEGTLSPADRARFEAHGLRNVALLTVPPVGSGAALAGVTSGIEPIFDLSYIRRSESLSQEVFKVYHPLVRLSQGGNHRVRSGWPGAHVHRG